jgi:hypothetical protein
VVRYSNKISNIGVVSHGNSSTRTIRVGERLDMAGSIVYSTARSRGGRLGFVTVLQASASPARYTARPGRQAVVAASLDALHGPGSGPVALPLWLFWSIPGHVFDLDDPDMRAWMYETVLREAGRPEDLAYLDGATLAALWPDLYLPRGVRQAWEDRHPVLLAATAGGAAAA